MKIPLTPSNRRGLRLRVLAVAAGAGLAVPGPLAKDLVLVQDGRYAGHRPHTMPWFRPQAIELDITPLARAGRRNQIALRVLNNIDVFGASGIYERMFLYARGQTGDRASLDAGRAGGPRVRAARGLGTFPAAPTVAPCPEDN